MEQVQHADEWIWVRLAELAGSTGSKARPDGRLPLDALVPKVLRETAGGCVSCGVFPSGGSDAAGPQAR